MADGGEAKNVVSFTGSIVPKNDACLVVVVGAGEANVGTGPFPPEACDDATATVGDFEINPVWMHDAVMAPAVVMNAASTIADDCTLTALVGFVAFILASIGWRDRETFFIAGFILRHVSTRELRADRFLKILLRAATAFPSSPL